MQSKVPSLVTCAGIALVTMVIVTYAMKSGERSRTVEHSIIAQTVEFQAPAINNDGAAEAACGKCGDNFCNPRCGETPTSCPRDCGGVPMDAERTVEPIQFMCGKCGDNFCNPRCGETPTSCPRDCGGQTSHVEDATRSFDDC
jgi:hypothetical protein